MNKLAILALTLIFATPAFGQQAFEIYVSDAGNFQAPPWQILKFDANGENPEVFIDQNLGWPQDILFLEGAGTVLVSNLNTGTITRYDADTGDFIDNFATGISGPTRLKIGPDNLLYVLQWNNSQPVRRYQLDGTFVDNFTSVGVNQAIGLDWDTAGNLYVSSFNGASVRRFDPQGNDLGFFISDTLIGPTNIWFNDAGEMLVLDYSGGDVKRFDSDGNYIDDFVLAIINAEGVDFYPNGDVLIGAGGSRSVNRYDSGGNFIEATVPSGSGGLMTPNAVVLRPLGGAGFQINAGLNDAWFNALTPGQGFFITVFPDIEMMFLAWFTYDTERPDPSVMADVGEPGHRWLTAFGP
ncbi:MAG: hypothetical protein R3212_03685, partial [Xanthomonadales bacterium]|nr:hypothetical protein [Xanthomonadales bacterium]